MDFYLDTFSGENVYLKQCYFGRFMKVKLYNSNELLEVSEKLVDASNILKKYLQRHHSNNTGSFFIKIKDHSIFINDVEIVSKPAKLPHSLLELLMEHCFHSYVMNRQEFEYLSIQKLMSILESKYGIIVNHEEQIRRSIKLIRKYIREKVGENCIIDTVRWKGYRLNPICVKLG